MKNKDYTLNDIAENLDSPETRYKILIYIRIAQIVSTVLVALGTIFLFLALLNLI